jgi:hypothetical protein
MNVWNFEIHGIGMLPLLLSSKWPRPKHSSWNFKHSLPIDPVHSSCGFHVLVMECLQYWGGVHMVFFVPPHWRVNTFLWSWKLETVQCLPLTPPSLAAQYEPVRVWVHKGQSCKSGVILSHDTCILLTKVNARMRSPSIEQLASQYCSSTAQ